MPLSTLSAGRGILNGRFAEAAIGGVLIGFLFEWSVDISTDTADTTAHGDVWQYNKPLDSGWTFKAKEYVPVATDTHILNTLYTTATVPVQVTVAGYSGTVAAGTKIFEGTGTPVHADLNAPMELATQGFEIRGNGSPSAGV